MVSTEHKYIFIHIPKTAGFSMEKFLYTPDCIWKSGVPIFLNQKFLTQSQHFTISEVKEIMSPAKFNQFKKFAAVRNPWDRMVSEYHFRQNALHDKRFKNFNEFIDILKDKSSAINFFGGEHGGQHFYSQVDFLNIDGDIDLDLILRFEDISKWTHKLKKILPQHPVWENENSFPHVNGSARDDYQSYYCKSTKNAVAELYADDIETFEYNF